MKLRYHIIATTTISSVVYYVSDSITAFVSSIIGGILIDVDHLLDYYRQEGFNLKIKYFFGWCYKLKWNTLVVPLHSIELVLILWFAIYVFDLGLFWLGFAIGFTQHMIFDIIFNNKITNNSTFYFFIYRFVKGFRKEYLIRKTI